MTTAAQLGASRGLLEIDQLRLAKMAALSLPTIQRTEACEGVIRGNVNSLVKLIEALDLPGVNPISEGAPSQSSGHAVRVKGLT